MSESLHITNEQVDETYRELVNQAMGMRMTQPIKAAHLALSAYTGVMYWTGDIFDGDAGASVAHRHHALVMAPLRPDGGRRMAQLLVEAIYHDLIGASVLEIEAWVKEFMP